MATSLNMEVSSLQVETTLALSEVRAALSALTKSLGPGIQRAADLQRQLKVDYKLSWRIFNVISEADAMAAAKLVPTAPSLRRLLTAAKGKGVTSDITERVKKAVADFDRVIERYADDRAEFDLMTSAIASAPAAAELAFRKSSFRSDSHIWGISNDVFCTTCMVRLNADAMTSDEVSLVTRLGRRRLRPDASLNVFSYLQPGAGGPLPGKERIPLDHKAAEQYGAHILPRFCSQPIPPFRTWQRPDGWTAVDVQSREIGRQHAINLALGQIMRGCPLAKGMSGEPYYQIGSRIAAPTRLLISNLLLHRPTFGAVRPELMMFRQTPGDENLAVARSATQLPIRDEIQYLGTGKAAWQIADVENHDEMVQMAFNEIGWNPAEFDVFRIRVEYPVLHSVVRMGFPLSIKSPIPEIGT